MNAAARLGIIMVTGAVAIAAVGYATGFEWQAWDKIGQPRNVLMVDGEQIRIPLPDGEPRRLAAEVSVTTSGSHGFMFEEAGQGPTLYDPCRPLAWVVNPDGMPEGAQQMIEEAVADVSRRTGLVFEYGGTTTEVASFDRPLFQERYGEDFAPIIVGWSDEDTVSDLEGSVTGLGGSSSVNGAYGEQRYLAAGVVILDSEDVADLMASQRGTALATAVIMHELAHVIGLAHVEDPSELMNAENSMLITWGPGDLQGLAMAGAGPCQ
ncbi:hypothetical protein [Demequina activiva]|uniref:Matrixin n=1 Tax=Demequina activiva TaxID=1582364 RepID=A0A919Q0W8_9MICO|nr:hypothetical protein [Demequina activiva]GIG54270.1 hypothetical protein Dac01nite_10220 [Demequina activiva]